MYSVVLNIVDYDEPEFTDNQVYEEQRREAVIREKKAVIREETGWCTNHVPWIAPCLRCTRRRFQLGPCQ